MKIRRMALSMVLCLSAVLCGIMCKGESLSAKDILTRMDEALFPVSFEMRAAMIDHRPNRKDIYYIIQLKAKKQAGSLMTFDYPASEAGKKYLFKDRTVWMMIPGISNPLRLSTKQSFMNSNFSNNDLMDTEYNDDYLPEIETILRINEREYYKIICTAKGPEVTYYKIVMTIDRENYIPYKYEYYSRSGMLIKTLSFSEIKPMAGRLRATKMLMKDESAQDEYTLVTIETMEEKSLPASYFSVDRLRR